MTLSGQKGRLLGLAGAVAVLLAACGPPKNATVGTLAVVSSKPDPNRRLPWARIDLDIGERIIGSTSVIKTELIPSSLDGLAAMPPQSAQGSCGCIKPEIVSAPGKKPELKFSFTASGPSQLVKEHINLIGLNHESVGTVNFTAQTVPAFKFVPPELKLDRAAGGKAPTASILVRVAPGCKPQFVPSGQGVVEVKITAGIGTNQFAEIRPSPKLVPGPFQTNLAWRDVSGTAPGVRTLLPVSGYISGPVEAHPRSLIFEGERSKGTLTTTFDLIGDLSQTSAMVTFDGRQQLPAEIDKIGGDGRRAKYRLKLSVARAVPGLVPGTILLKHKEKGSILRIPFQAYVSF